MPIYEYRCTECGNEFEAMVWTGEDERETPCPECGKKRPERLLSAFAAISSRGSGAKACNSLR